MPRAWPASVDGGDACGARPGEHENEAIADYVFKPAVRARDRLLRAGRAGENAHYPHYHGGEAELKPDDLVLFDYAPDYRYYSSDVTRMFPRRHVLAGAEGALHGLSEDVPGADGSIRPTPAPRDIMRDAVAKMDAHRRPVSLLDDVHRQAAQAFVERYRGNTRNSARPHRRHGSARREAADRHAEAGMIFTIEPALTDPRRARLHPSRGRDPHHRDRLREPVGVPADGGRRHREADGRDRPVRGQRPPVARSRARWRRPTSEFATVAAPSSPACGFRITLSGIVCSRSDIGPFWRNRSRNAAAVEQLEVLRRDPAADVDAARGHRAQARGCPPRRRTPSVKRSMHLHAVRAGARARLRGRDCRQVRRRRRSSATHGASPCVKW